MTIYEQTNAQTNERIKGRTNERTNERTYHYFFTGDNVNFFNHKPGFKLCDQF